ncbi:cytoskeleton protein RodZ [Vibrio cholerae]
MTAEHETTETNQPQEHIEAGTLLKQKREQLGLTQKQIADRLRLRLSIIENLEKNDFESDQVATFTRGYLRSYAKAVGLKESVVLAALDHSGTAQHKEQSMQSFSRKTKREKHDSRIMILTWGIFAVIAGISSLWWWQNQQDDMLDLSQPSAQETTQQSADPSSGDTLDFVSLDEAMPDEPSQETQETMEPILSEDSDVSGIETLENTQTEMSSETEIIREESALESPAETVTASDSAEQVDAPQESATDTAVAVTNRLEMNFSDDCWVQVKDASGKTLVTGIKKGGESVALDGQSPYSVILGAPENVSMTLASEPVDLSGYTSGKVARFTLP